jgi:branched-chain amino acid transport system substrate-binding protein
MYGVQALQVALAAIARSDGTRRGVRDAVFEGAGLTVPAATAVYSKDVQIQPWSGDIAVRDVMILGVENGRGVVHKTWRIE